ncbi:MAG: TPR repeat protein, partial [Myxococcota bacterium]
MKWYRKAADLGHVGADLGHVGATFALGKSLIRTAGDDANKVGKALALLVAAADGGLERAKLWAGLVYFDGPKGTRDRTKAMAWLLPFAHKGDPNAQFCV